MAEKAVANMNRSHGVLSFGLVSLVVWCSSAPTLGAEGGDPLFGSNELLAVKLAGPLRSLARDRSDEPEERDGRLSFTDSDGTLVDVPIKLSPRGNSRRNRQVCSFPPLSLELPKKELDGTLFEHQKSLKLVTYCKTQDRYQQYLLKEYLAYRIFNLLTDDSLRVRLLQIEYVDEDRGDKTLIRLGFVIEHFKRFAKRIGVTRVKPITIPREQLEPGQASLVELFEYLLGNVDFSLVSGPTGDDCCHNAKLFQTADGLMLPLPYDFDMTGFVDPPYGSPNEQLKQRNIRQRIYRGLCREGDYHQNAIARAQEMRQPIEQLIRDQAGLDDENRKQALSYVEEFYDVLDDPQKLQEDILDACRYPI